MTRSRSRSKERSSKDTSSKEPSSTEPSSKEPSSKDRSSRDRSSRDRSRRSRDRRSSDRRSSGRDRSRRRDDYRRDRDRDRDRRYGRDRDRRYRGRDRDRDRRRRRRRSPSTSSSSSSSDDEGAAKSGSTTAGAAATAPGSLLWQPANGAPNPALAAITPNIALLLGQRAAAGLPFSTGNPIQDKKQCELYVGNLLTGHVSDLMLAQCFTEMFKGVPAFDASKGPAVRNVQLSGSNFGFVEFRDVQTTATAMQFAGAQLLGRPLKIGRPTGYVPSPIPIQPLPVPQELLTKLGCNSSFQLNANPVLGGGASRIDDKKQREVWVGNLSKEEVSNEMLHQLFQAMLLGQPNSPPNPVVNVQLGANGMYAFVELATPELATLCIQIFDGIQLKGRPMKVGRPTGYVDPNRTNNTGLYGAGAGAPGMTSLAALGINPPPPPPPPATPNPDAGPPSAMICLENLVSEEELKSDEEYPAIKQDIEEECKKSGPIVRLEIPRPGTEGVDPSTVGKAFIAFETVAAAQAAVTALDGRPFGPNTVKATFITEDKFPKTTSS